MSDWPEFDEWHRLALIRYLNRQNGVEDCDLDDDIKIAKKKMISSKAYEDIKPLIYISMPFLKGLKE